MTLRAGALLTGALLLLAAACGGEEQPPATPTSPPGVTATATAGASPTAGMTATPSSTPTAATTATATATPTPFTGTRGPVEGEGTVAGIETALLVQVRTGRHEGFDRIVFQFEKGIPSYRIEYVEPPILGEFSGLPVEIEGSAFLRVRFGSAAAHDPETGERTYMGPLDLAIGQPSLLEAEVTGDFEGALTWVLGLSEEVDLRVFALEEPFRVAIDVAQP